MEKFDFQKSEIWRGKLWLKQSKLARVIPTASISVEVLGWTLSKVARETVDPDIRSTQFLEKIFPLLKIWWKQGGNFLKNHKSKKSSPAEPRKPHFWAFQSIWARKIFKKKLWFLRTPPPTLVKNLAKTRRNFLKGEIFSRNWVGSKETEDV